MTGFLPLTAIRLLLIRVLNSYFSHIHILPIFDKRHFCWRYQQCFDYKFCACSSYSNFLIPHYRYYDILIVVDLLTTTLLLHLWPVTQKVSVFFKTTYIISRIENITIWHKFEMERRCSAWTENVTYYVTWLKESWNCGKMFNQYNFVDQAVKVNSCSEVSCRNKMKKKELDVR